MLSKAWKFLNEYSFWHVVLDFCLGAICCTVHWFTQDNATLLAAFFFLAMLIADASASWKSKKDN